MNPAGAFRAVKILTERVKEKDWENTLDSFARCVRITRSQDGQFDLRPAGFAIPAEQKLLTAYQNAAAHVNSSVPAFVTALREMVPAINGFFDEVLVMDKDTAVRENRLALLQHIANLTEGMADLSHLEGF